MSTTYHCPYRQSALLQQALAPNKMRIAFLLGAGCPMAIRTPDPDNAQVMKPLIPDIAGLTQLVAETLVKDDVLGHDYSILLKRLGIERNPTIEEILSHLRSLIEVVRDGSIDGLTLDRLQNLDTKICELTAEVVGAELPLSITPYHNLAAWMSNIARVHPIEIFTPNYDLLLEQALESHKVPYFDGFIGVKEAFFDLSSMETDILPARWARLWKLHGSINWWRTSNNDVVRKHSGNDRDRLMIYPSHLKYDQSRRLPYLAMLDRLRDFLGRGQAVLVCSGYSFADQHLNEVIMNGLRSNPTAMCFGLLYGNREQYPEAIQCASKRPNLSLLASDGAILGTLDRAWSIEVQTGHPMHNFTVFSNPNGVDGCKFTLGDFKTFGDFLAHQINHNAAWDIVHEA